MSSTARSRRRDAELAVIDAAKAYVLLRVGAAALTPTEYFAEAFGKLAVASHRLDLVDMGAPDVVRTGNNNPCITSSQAAEVMRRSAGKVAGEVFAAIYQAYLGGGVGYTVEQLERRLGRSHQSVSPRVTDLRDKGLIKDSGEKRKTLTGNDAVVWTPTDIAIEAAKSKDLPWTWTTP